MFRDRDLLHGAALGALLDSDAPVTITGRPDVHDSAYEFRVGRRVTLALLKCSTKPKSPWQFTLTEGEIDAVASMRGGLRGSALMFSLVCNKDGVCGALVDELRAVSESGELVVGAYSVYRKRHGSYHLFGPGRVELPHAIAQSDWSRRIREGT